jgi:hypothetical protein
MVLASCGGTSAQTPLDVPVGLRRDQLRDELRRFEYCQKEEVVDHTEVFPRCKITGTELGESWVVAHYDESGRAVKVQRWERYAEEQRGLDRFNALIEKRSAQSGPPSDDAKAQLSAQQPLPEGTKTWVAFTSGTSALVGVYLLDPSPPQNAMILEELVEVAAPR